MKRISIFLISLFVFLALAGMYLWPFNSIFLLAYGGLCLLCWLLFHWLSLREERDLLKEGIQYLIDAFQGIRSPVSLIKTPLTTVYDGDCPDPVRRELDIALRNIDGLERHLTALTGLKDFFAHSGSVRPEVAEHELGAFMRHQACPLRSYAAAQNLEIEVVQNFEYASVWLDRDKISPVIDRFVTHAVDRALPGTRLVLQILLEEDYWGIRIKDSGNGQLLRHFKRSCPWWSLSGRMCRLKRKTDGVFFRKMLHLCGGELSVSGEEVLLSFPMKRPSGKSSARCGEGGLYPFACDEAESFSRLPSDRKETDKPLMVLADSDVKFRDYIERRMSEYFHVRSFADGAEALQAIGEERPDIVLCDVMLHGMGGEELSSSLKKEKETSFIPVILSGSRIDAGWRAKRKGSLANLFLCKPFDIEDLKVEISVLMTNHHYMRKAFLQRMFGEDFLVEQVNESLRIANFKFITDVNNFVMANLEKEDLVVDDIASNMCMSRTTFYNKWKSLAGEAPKYLISRMRMEKARELLESGGYSVAGVAEMVGMRNLKNFRSRYKEYFGKTPKESLKKR